MGNNGRIAVGAAVESVDSILMIDPTDGYFTLNDPESIRHLSGEKKLTWSILANGIHQLQLNIGKKTRRQIHQYEEAHEWIFSKNTSWLFSFLNCCYILSIDPAYLREGIGKFINKCERK